jgi:hypothetical protein
LLEKKENPNLRKFEAVKNCLIFEELNQKKSKNDWIDKLKPCENNEMELDPKIYLKN